MFNIGVDGQGRARLVADQKLGEADFRAIAAALGEAPVRYRKFGRVRARPAVAGERVTTRWGGKESANTAKEGDWVVTALGPDDAPLRDGDGNENVYVVPAGRFGELYEAVDAGGSVWRPRGIVLALHFPGGFEILAPWGEMQRGASGYLLLNGPDVYGNNADTFEATYQVMPDSD
jgi:hypothetical protein